MRINNVLGERGRDSQQPPATLVSCADLLDRSYCDDGGTHHKHWRDEGIVEDGFLAPEEENDQEEAHASQDCRRCSQHEGALQYAPRFSYDCFPLPVSPVGESISGYANLSASRAIVSHWSRRSRDSGCPSGGSISIKNRSPVGISAGL